MASSQDASVKVYAKQDLSKGHRYGPFKARLTAIGPTVEVEMGQWKIYADDGEKCFQLESNDFSIPGWLRFVKITKESEEQTLTLIQQGKTFYFEVTKDVTMGMEHGILGIREEEAPEDPSPNKKRRGRPRKIKLTPEQQAELDEERRKKKEEEKNRRLEQAASNAVTGLGLGGRNRKCVVCGQKFADSIVFMKHRRACGVIKEVEGEKLDEEEEGEDEDEEVPIDDTLGTGGLDEESMDADDLQQPADLTALEGSIIDDVEGVENGEGILDDTGEIEAAPGTSSVWPTGMKRPRGRPRKDGKPPIVRKKRGRKRKRRRYNDDDDFSSRLARQAMPPPPECTPTANHPEKYPFTCETCNNNFPTQSWYDLHMEQHENPRLQYLICNLCDEAFRFLMTYTNHMDSIHSGMTKRDQTMSEKFRCDICKKAFRSPIHLERHIRRANNAEPPPKGPIQVKCKFCDKTFTMEQGLENHTMKAHSEYKRYQCTADDCLETFDSKEERATHLSDFHGLDPCHIYKCPVAGCSKAYMSVSSLNYHYALRHTLDKPFACEVCGKTWVKIGRLREHMKTHSTEKNELCDECGRAFKTRPELKDHKLEAHTDSGKEKLQCRFCTATFSRRSSRSYHERKHRNEAPYVCPKPGCNKRFVAVIDYKRHLIYHTGAKLYRCRYCSNCFTRSDYLKGHEKRHNLRGEQIDAAPPIEETVTIKVPWPMEKPVKIQGQNVVVSIEPDPSLNVDNDMTTEALIALDHLQNVPVELADGTQVVTTTDAGDIVQQAAHQAMSSDMQGTQLLFHDGSTYTTHTASAAMQEAVAQVQAASGMAEMAEGGAGSEALPEETQILLQAASEQAQALIQGGMDGTQIMMEGATSEQAALVLQHLAAENAQVIVHPSGQEGMSTMQATLQNENGETSIVLVNLATQPDGSVTAITTEQAEQIALQAAAGNATLAEDGSMIISTTEVPEHLGGGQEEEVVGNQMATVTTSAEDATNHTVSMTIAGNTIQQGEDGQMILVVEQGATEETSEEQTKDDNSQEQ